jgi:uncharacterized protein with PQ loop repeat
MFNKLFKLEKRIEKNAAPYIDKLFYLGGVLSPIIATPQIYKIYHLQDAHSVSLLSWGSYFIGVLFLLIYGVIHKQKPIVFMNATVLPVYLLVIIGIIIYG